MDSSGGNLRFPHDCQRYIAYESAMPKRFFKFASYYTNIPKAVGG